MTIKEALKISLEPFKTERIEWDDAEGHHIQEPRETMRICFAEFCMALSGLLLQLFRQMPESFEFGWETNDGASYTPGNDKMQNAIDVFTHSNFVGSGQMFVVLQNFICWLLKQEAVQDDDFNTCWYMSHTLTELWNAYVEACDFDIFRGPAAN